MAAPAIQTTSSGTATAAAASVTLPTSHADGDLILVFLQCGLAATVTWSQTSGTTGWTELIDTNNGSIWYKQIGGSEANPSFDLSSSSRHSWYAIRIDGHEDPATTAPAIPTESTGTSGAPDPPASTTPTASGDHLFIGYCRGRNGKSDVDTYPSWNDHQGEIGQGHTLGGFVSVAAEAYLASGTTQDCGAWAIDESGSLWHAGCVLVESPGAAVESGDGTIAATSTAAATGAPIFSADGTIAWTSTVAATGISTFAADGTAAGTSTAAGVGTGIVPGVGTAAGTCVVAGVGFSINIQTGDGTITAVSTAAAVGASTVAADGTSTWTSTAAATGISTHAGVGTITATSTAAAVGTAVGLVVAGTNTSLVPSRDHWGPHVYGTTNLCTLAYPAAATPGMYATVDMDPDSGIEEKDSGNRPGAHAGGAMASCIGGGSSDEVGVISVGAGSADDPFFDRYSMATQTWAETDDELEEVAHSLEHVGITWRPTAAEYVVAYNGELDSTYEMPWWSRRTGASTWSSPVKLGPAAPAADTRLFTLLLGAEDMVHVVLEYDGDLYVRTIKADNSLSSWPGAPFVSGGTYEAVAAGVRYDTTD